ncbi:MAG: hypothetical protein IT370_15375 [Deltaproteobacteria bacterium]|nr:hypothetical protein [Deltaproteobacteria bacterium]
MRAASILALISWSAAACSRIERDDPDPAARAAAAPAVVPASRSLTLDLMPPDVGPLPSLAALQRWAEARGGNDAPRIFDPRPSWVTGPARLARPRGPFRSARVVGLDNQGDFIDCALVLETDAGFFLFDGPVCENSMNDDPYAFRVEQLEVRALRGGQPVLVFRSTASELYPWTSEHTWLRVCIAHSAPTGQPACASILAARHFADDSVPGGDLRWDFAPRLLPDGSVEVPPHPPIIDWPLSMLDEPPAAGRHALVPVPPG